MFADQPHGPVDFEHSEARRLLRLSRVRPHDVLTLRDANDLTIPERHPKGLFERRYGALRAADNDGQGREDLSENITVAERMHRALLAEPRVRTHQECQHNVTPVYKVSLADRWQHVSPANSRPPGSSPHPTLRLCQAYWLGRDSDGWGARKLSAEGTEGS
jgi:hypothetical protein